MAYIYFSKPVIKLNYILCRLGKMHNVMPFAVYSWLDGIYTTFSSNDVLLSKLQYHGVLVALAMGMQQ